MDNKEKGRKGLKIWQANLIAIAIEIVIVVAYFALCWEAIENVLSGDISGGIDDAIVAVWFLIIATLIASIGYLVIKPMRTKTNIGLAIFNLIWVVGNIIMMCS